MAPIPQAVTQPTVDAREVISKKEAIEKGLKKYFTGIPCKRGHVVNRHVVSGVCEECLRTYNREIYSKKPEVKERRKEANKRSYEKNREKVLQRGKKKVESGYMRDYYQKNKEKAILKAREWSKNNQDKKNAYRQNRRARGEKRLSPEEVERIVALQKGKCAICKSKLEKTGRHIDHIVPITKGGTSHPHNIQMLCPTCNRKKSNADPIDYMQRIGLLL